MYTAEIAGWFTEGEARLREAVAFWVDEPGVGTLRREPIERPGEDEVLVRTRWTGVSRGTEASVFQGHVPPSEYDRMRAPFQEGEFPGPVKYGYLNVGVVEEGPDPLRGRTVFTLFPHQSAFVVPADAVVAVPAGVPARRAVLAGAVETAVNVLWDAAPLIGDRVTIVGAGMIGCCVARLARGIPGLEVVLVDVDPSRRVVADRLGVGFAEPDDAPRSRDLVVNASGSGAGLQLALESIVTDGEVIEASWYGDRPVTLALGADFHSRRLTIRASQVGAVARRRRGTRSTGDRLGLALELLKDEAFDALLTGDSPWNHLPAVMAALADGQGTELCHTIDWTDAP
ncbi:threonine dehydrogenase-like Zn-dependent dehydrogenase [Agromyces flavus]|uniref:Threonine dehydrogenase n=1 Tax=Agromyces flavus TaxID=589382 RepID=A0A1H1SLM5_9MICO|nr:zinc-binding alcohol dehydrogenase [Agromyces flavus]MCP2369043.1 threonine dehydrogenase-like Zn-dependent dehydrogenase [Agromyces flavus]GGI48498.1 dehydrogenase [Agromyces flavus]SDS48733.1 Threonine dehydrogenase [Agromyces flavus]